MTIETPRGEYQVEVPTTLGPDAAGRRAMFSIAAAYEQSTDLGQIRVTGTELLN